MSIPSKARKAKKNNEYTSKSEPGVQKHQKTHEHTIKNKKNKKTKAWSRTCKWLGEKSIVIFNADARATYVTTYVVRCYGHTNAD